MTQAYIEVEAEAEAPSRWRELFYLWLQWEIVGALVFFTFFDWADVIAMACVAVDPEGEQRMECDLDTPQEKRVYTTRAHLERWGRGEG